MKTAILFDLDGTLLDTLADIHAAVNHSLALRGYPERTLEEVRQFVGNGAERLFDLAVPAGADPRPSLEEFRRWYPEHCEERTGPYEGIPETLAVLGEKYPLAIVSNKPDPAVKPLCRKYFPGIFAIGESPACPRKPAPDMVRRALEELGADRCVYVGDSEVDVLTAKNAGVPCVSVLWGFRTRQEIAPWGESVFCEDPRQLPQIIEELLHGK